MSRHGTVTEKGGELAAAIPRRPARIRIRSGHSRARDEAVHSTEVRAKEALVGNDDDLRDMPDDPETSKHKGITTGVGFAVIAFGLFLLGTVIYTAASSNPPGVTTCSTTCAGLTRWECPGARFMGGCLGISICSPPIHACGVNPP
jgi:hypothetical protein